MFEKENQNTKMKKMWRVIAKSLGEKSGKNDKEADKIALVRLLMFLSILITNSFIVANALRHWNDKTTVYVYVDDGSCSTYQTPSPQRVNKTLEFE